MLSWKVLSKDDIIYKSCNTQYDIILVTGEQESSRVHNQLMSYPANKLHQLSHKPCMFVLIIKIKQTIPKMRPLHLTCWILTAATSSTATLLVSHHHNISKPNLHRSWPTLYLPTISLLGPTAFEFQFQEYLDGQLVKPSWCLLTNTYLFRRYSHSHFTLKRYKQNGVKTQQKTCKDTCTHHSSK